MEKKSNMKNLPYADWLKKIESSSCDVFFCWRRSHFVICAWLTSLCVGDSVLLFTAARKKKNRHSQWMLVNGLVFIVHQNPSQTKPNHLSLSLVAVVCWARLSRTPCLITNLQSKRCNMPTMCVCGSNKPLYPIRILLLNHTQKTHIFTNVFATTDQNDGTTTTTKNLSYLDAYKFICVASARFRK